MNEPTTPIRCARCQVYTARPGGVCDDCERRLTRSARCRRPRHYSDIDDVSPWQEYAIRLMEDQA